MGYTDFLPFYAGVAVIIYALRGYFRPFCAWLARLMDTPKFDEEEVNDNG